MRVYCNVLFFILFLVSSTHAQKQNNVWVFGDSAGLNFNTSPPSPYPKAGVSGEKPYYTSSICDKNGNLLFYTDGWKVWNNKNKTISKYMDRWPWSLQVVPLICPYPDNDSLFYIFGVSSGSYANRLQYLTINVKGNYGAGEIVYPQPSTLSNYFTVLLSNTSVVVAGTAHCNRKDTWIVTHSQNAFYSFLVTAQGVNPTPVVSSIPADVLTPGTYAEMNIKFSASGEKLIMPLSTNEIVVLDFNNFTGSFSNAFKIKLPEGSTLDDAEISPDGSKLYFGAASKEDEDATTVGHFIYQMDLNAGSPGAIEKTIVNLTTVPDREGCSPHVCFFLYRTMQLAPDGKIYVSMRDLEGDVPIPLDKTASVIEEPNELGAKCRYNKNAVNVGRKYKFIQYNYIRSSTFTIKENGIQFQKKVCADQPANFSLLYNRVDSVKWDFGDLSSGSNNYSTAQNPQHAYPAPGTYSVKAIIYNKCFVDTAYANVSIEEDKSVKIPANVKDSVVCVGNTLLMDATTPGATDYTWGGGNTKPVQEITVTGRYEIMVMNECSVDVRVFDVTFEKCDCKVFVPTAFTPNGDGLNDDFKPLVKCAAEDYRFVVYNRFGNIVYSSSTVNEGWNGTIKNIESPHGTYIWMVQYRDPNNHQLLKQHGTVVLIR